MMILNGVSMLIMHSGHGLMNLGSLGSFLTPIHRVEEGFYPHTAQTDREILKPVSRHQLEALMQGPWGI